MTSLPIEVYADVTCPFAHVLITRLVASRDSAGSDRTVVVRAWPLELVNDEPTPVSKIADEVRALKREAAPDLFADFRAQALPPTTLPLLDRTAAAYAADVRCGERIALRLRHEIFEDGRRPADGAAPVENVRGQVLADLERGRQRGVKGSPHFFVGDADFFCPGLVLEHDSQGALAAVYRDDAAFDRFLAHALGPR